MQLFHNPFVIVKALGLIIFLVPILADIFQLLPRELEVSKDLFQIVSIPFVNERICHYNIYQFSSHLQ
jgi:type II secretory pathway component PulF